MNSTIYLFGNLGQGITLYPNDYTKNIFKEFISRANAPTQLIIHRDGTIMNYGYIRKIENDQVIGVSFQINGQYLTAIKPLFEVFEDIIANITVRGEIIRLNNQGNLIGNISKLTDKTKEVERIIGYCQTELLKMSASCLTLPNIDYSTSDSDISNFKDTDSNKKIINSSVKNGYTFVYKAYDYDTLALSGYRSTLYTLNKENEANKLKVKELDSKLSVLRRQKKQMNVVVCLVLLMLICTIIFFNTLDEKNRNIQSQQVTIENQTTENSKLTNENKLIHNSKAILQNQYSSLQKEHGELDEKFDSLLRQYNSLVTSYKTLQSTTNERQKKIDELQSEKSTLEIRCNNYSRNITQKENDYSTLQKKYNALSNSYDVLSNKYFSTKEGKKELKKKR